METKARRLLEKSIKKWERILRLVKANEGEIIQNCCDDDGMRFGIGKPRSYFIVGIDACPLCSGDGKNPGYHAELCAGCPVAKRTGCLFCTGTPYDHIENITSSYGFGDKKVKVTKRLIKLVEKEVVFLKSLK